jgi:macrodomain Ter protein organizer (MatP/YcbG family)
LKKKNTQAVNDHMNQKIRGFVKGFVKEKHSSKRRKSLLLEVLSWLDAITLSQMCAGHALTRQEAKQL